MQPYPRVANRAAQQCGSSQRWEALLRQVLRFASLSRASSRSLPKTNEQQQLRATARTGVQLAGPLPTIKGTRSSCQAWLFTRQKDTPSVSPSQGALVSSRCESSLWWREDAFNPEAMKGEPASCLRAFHRGWSRTEANASEQSGASPSQLTNAVPTAPYEDVYAAAIDLSCPLDTHSPQAQDKQLLTGLQLVASDLETLTLDLVKRSAHRRFNSPALH